MKCIRVEQHGGPEVLKMVEMPDPQPGPSQVVIQVKAVGVNPVDTYIRSGAYANAKVPYTPGFDAAGTVIQVGAEVKNVALGDRVYTSSTLTGAYAEKTLAEASAVHRLPANVSFRQAAGINIPFATAYRALVHKAQAKAGETVLVHGASGGVGTAAVQIGKALGLVVIGTAGSSEGLKLVKEQGAAHALNHRDSDYLEKLMGLTGGRGVDIILEMLANVNLGKDLPLLARDGRVIVIGSRGKVEIMPRDLMSREASVHGMTLFNASPKEIQSIHAALYVGLENGTLWPIVGKEYPLSEGPRAHKEILEPGAHGKILLLP